MSQLTAEGAEPVKLGAAATSATGAATAILLAISFSHLLNDTMQSLFPAIYPLLKTSFQLSYTQIGVITLVFQMTASLLQPVVGLYSDRRPQPYSLAAGMGFTLVGLVLLSFASSFPVVVIAAALVGMGSSVFHPEASRVARMASGGRHGRAQSVFQVGGNIGSALGPLLAAFIVLPAGQGSIAWFSLVALLAMVILARVGGWYKAHLAARAKKAGAAIATRGFAPRKVQFFVLVLVALTFSKFLFNACFTSYYTFFLIERFGMSIRAAQLYLFVYLAAVALGTLVGGSVSDRFGRKNVIWFSILGVLPFSLALPYADLFWTGALSVVIGFVLASAFPTIIVFAQELVPGNVGMIAGIFFGIAFGMGGLGAAVLGKVADATDIEFVFRICSYLPLIGLVAVFLPSAAKMRSVAARA